MARLTLLTLPPEIIYAICGCLDDHSDVSNFRLVNRVLSSVGFVGLAPKVSFVLLQDSLDRLEEFSTHPVIRHHVHTVECIHYPLLDLNPIKLHSSYRGTVYKRPSLFKSKQLSQQLVDIFKGFTNLKRIEISGFKPTHTCPEILVHGRMAPDILRADDYEPLICCFLPEIPTVELLSLLLPTAVVPKTPVRSLNVRFIGLHFFDTTEWGQDFLDHGLAMLETIDFEVSLLTDPFMPYGEDLPTWNNARGTLAKGGVKRFLVSLPALKSIRLSFTRRQMFITESINVLPTESTWSRLQTLSLYGMNVDCSTMIAFLASHSQFLKYLSLSNCNLVPAEGQDPQHPLRHPQHRWSTIFIFLCTNLSLEELFLAGPFLVSGRYGESDYPLFRMTTPVQNVRACVRDVLQTLVCSKSFDAYLEHKARKFPGEDPAKIKKRVIEDLVDDAKHEMVRRYGEVYEATTTVYDFVIRPFFLLKGPNRDREATCESIPEIFSWH